MPLLYASVSRGIATQAEYAAAEGNFGGVAAELLDKAARNEGKFTYTVDGYTFNFLTCDGFTFLVVADGAYGRAIPSAFLDKAQVAFADTYGSGTDSDASSMAAGFSKQLKQMMERAALQPASYSKAAQVQSKVDEARGIVTDNLERVLQRGERLELLTDRSDDLITESALFHRHARALRWRLAWGDARTKLAAAAVVLLVVLLVLLLVCALRGGCSTK